MKIEGYLPTREEINEIMSMGADAFQAKNSIQDCHYPKHTEEYRLWVKGFNNAKFSTMLSEKNAEHSD